MNEAISLRALSLLIGICMKNIRMVSRALYYLFGAAFNASRSRLSPQKKAAQYYEYAPYSSVPFGVLALQDKYSG